MLTEGSSSGCESCHSFGCLLLLTEAAVHPTHDMAPPFSSTIAKIRYGCLHVMSLPVRAGWMQTQAFLSQLWPPVWGDQVDVTCRTARHTNPLSPQYSLVAKDVPMICQVRAIHALQCCCSTRTVSQLYEPISKACFCRIRHSHIHVPPESATIILLLDTYFCQAPDILAMNNHHRAATHNKASTI